MSSKRQSDIDPLKVLGATIRDLRKERGWNQGQLAVRSNTHENYVWGVEKGLRNISAINLLHLAAAFGVHPCELFRGFSLSDLKRLPEKGAKRLRSGSHGPKASSGG